ncbi:MAG: 2-iminoacetate synthase ThiH [Fibrobacter sp.]|nr:2-iminoacetate synthase ThiH [Fibrobacter sp.]
MSFFNYIDQFNAIDINGFCSSVTARKVESILSRDTITEMDFLALLSDEADKYLENIAQKARLYTCRNFGKVVKIFTPMYISNLCENVCAYCSFARHHSIVRRHLSFDEICAEGQKIRETGIRHLLVLTGEAPGKASVEYIRTAVTILREYFSSVSIEVYPLTQSGYKEVIDAGADGLTIYQETYNRELYTRLHSGGPKGDYIFRIEAPDRACKEGIRAVTVGALFGLYEWRYEAFFTALHAAYLQKKYPSVEVSVSFPRLRPLVGDFTSEHILSDRQFVRILTALRLFLPSVGITVSTRESEALRNAVLPMGVTKMSAGVSTAVGGHSGNASTSQFEIADCRDVEKMCSDLISMGYQPVMHDWNNSYVL